MTGPQRKARVRSLQAHLNAKYGARLKVDGIDGELTWAATEAALKMHTTSTTDTPPDPSILSDRTKRNIATLDPKARGIMTRHATIAQTVAARHGCDAQVISGNRTYAEQDRLYAQGRTRPGAVVTNARGGYSNHNFGVAVDYGIFRDGKYLDGGTGEEKRLAERVHREIAKAAKDAGVPTEWGGDWRSFKDYPHHEVATGLTMAQKRRRYAERGSVFG